MSEPSCACGEETLVKDGFTSKGRQQYFCRKENKRFSFSPTERISPRKLDRFYHLLAQGNSIREIARQTGIHQDTISRRIDLFITDPERADSIKFSPRQRLKFWWTIRTCKEEHLSISKNLGLNKRILELEKKTGFIPRGIAGFLGNSADYKVELLKLQQKFFHAAHYIINDLAEKTEKMKKEGKTMQQIAEEFKCSRATLYKYLKMSRKKRWEKNIQTMRESIKNIEIKTADYLQRHTG
jgi:DNA-binding CsgD family transcriptional regulator